MAFDESPVKRDVEHGRIPVGGRLQDNEVLPLQHPAHRAVAPLELAKQLEVALGALEAHERNVTERLGAKNKDELMRILAPFLG